MSDWDQFQTTGTNVEPTWIDDTSTPSEEAAPIPAEPEDAPKPKRSRSGKHRPASARRGVDTRLVAIAAKAIELTQANEDDLDLLSALYGKSDLAELAVAIQDGTKDAATALDSLLTVRTSDDLTAGVTIAGMSPADVKAVWALAQSFGADLAATPSQPAHAAIALVKAVRDLPATVDARLETISGLAAKA